MPRKLLLLALGAAAAALVISSRRRPRVGDPSGNGGPSRRSGEIRRLVGEARERLQARAPE
jgi:hypothetical protein